MEIQTAEIDSRPIYDPVAIARQFVAEAVRNLETARQQEMEEAEAEADERILERLRLSAAARKTWITRKANQAAQIAQGAI